MTTAATQAITTIVREGLTVLALFGYLFYQNAKLTLVFFLLGPPLALIINWIGKKIKLYGRGIQASVGELNHVSAEVFSGIRLIKSSVGESNANKRFRNVSSRTKKLTLKMSKISCYLYPYDANDDHHGDGSSDVYSTSLSRHYGCSTAYCLCNSGWLVT